MIHKALIHQQPVIGVKLADQDDTFALAAKAAALAALERDEEALRILDDVLRLDLPDRGWVLGIKAQSLIQVAEYQAAIVAVNDAIRLSPRAGWLWGAKGWASLFLEVPQPAEALDAFKAGIAVEKEDLWLHRGAGDALSMIGDFRAAESYYEWVINHSSTEPGRIDASELALRGWCNYRLKHYDDAIRQFIDTLSGTPDQVSTRFDLGLALMCSEQYSLAVNEYTAGLKSVNDKPPLRRRGLLSVAISDLLFAIKENQRLERVAEASNIKALLTKEYDQVKTLRPQFGLG